MTFPTKHGMTRRGFCLCCIGASAAARVLGWLTPHQAFAEARGIVDLIKSEAAKAPISVHRLRGNIAVLEGSGGNVAVLTGRDGKLLIDTGIGVSRAQMATALATLGPQPITQLINTHWHFDHANGNEWLHSAGANILVHDNTRKYLLKTQRVEDWNFDFTPPSAGALPADVFSTSRDVRFEGSTIALKYYGPAHIDSDIAVTFKDADIVHTGDTYWNSVYPFIDYSTGGSIDGSIRAANANLATTTDQTIVIPGHGQPISNRAQLADFRDMLVAISENVATLKKRGKSLEDIIAAKPTAAFDTKWGNFVVSPDFFTKLVYEGV